MLFEAGFNDKIIRPQNRNTITTGHASGDDYPEEPCIAGPLMAMDIIVQLYT